MLDQSVRGEDIHCFCNNVCVLPGLPKHLVYSSYVNVVRSIWFLHIRNLTNRGRARERERLRQLVGLLYISQHIFWQACILYTWLIYGIKLTWF